MQGCQGVPVRQRSLSGTSQTLEARVTGTPKLFQYVLFHIKVGEISMDSKLEARVHSASRLLPENRL